MDPASLIYLGRLCHKNGARETNGLLPADLLVDGITKRPASTERRGRAGEYGRRSSDMYKGANPFSDLNVN